MQHTCFPRLPTFRRNEPFRRHFWANAFSALELYVRARNKTLLYIWCSKWRMSVEEPPQKHRCWTMNRWVSETALRESNFRSFWAALSGLLNFLEITVDYCCWTEKHSWLFIFQFDALKNGKWKYYYHIISYHFISFNCNIYVLYFNCRVFKIIGWTGLSNAI